MTSVTGVRFSGLPENMGVFIGEMASSMALTPSGTDSISPPPFKNDRVWRSSRRRISCFDGGFFNLSPSPIV